MTPSPFRILARLEMLKVRAFWRVAGRDIAFDVALVIGGLIAAAGLARLFRTALAQPPAVAFFVAFDLGWLLYRQAYPGPCSKVRASLVAGPFHVLVVNPSQMARRLAMRTGVVVTVAALGSAAVLACLNLPASGLYLVAVALGAGASAGLNYRRESAPSAPKGRVWDARAAKVAGHATKSAQPLPRRHPVVAIALLNLGRRKLGAPAGGWAVAVLALGGAAAALAAHNNDKPGMGVSLASIAALGAGLLLMPAGQIVGLLGREPVSLSRLYWRLYALPFAAGVLGGALVTLCAGLGSVLAVEVALSALAGLALITSFVFLDRLTHSQRLAATATVLEFAAALILSAVQVSLAPTWLAVRGVILGRQARSMRWLDR